MKKSFNAYIYTNKAEEVYVFPVFVIHPLKCCILITSASAGLMERLRLLNHGKEGCKGNISYSIWQTTASDITHIGQKES